MRIKYSILVFGSLLVTGLGSSFLFQKSLKAEVTFPPATPDLNITEADKLKTPIILPANKNLPSSRFTTQAWFARNIDKRAVLKSYQLMTYGEYIASNPLIGRDYGISLDRMVTVVTVDWPRGLKASHADYSSARVVSVRDAQTQRPITYSITGKVISNKNEKMILAR